MARPAHEASEAATPQITGCSERPKQWHYASAPKRIIGRRVLCVRDIPGVVTRRCGYLASKRGEHSVPLVLPGCSWRSGNLAELRVLVPHRIPTSPVRGGGFPTESPRTRRHSPAHDGTDANMPLPPLTVLYAGSTGLTILELPVVPAATGLLLSGRSRVRVAVGAPLLSRPGTLAIDSSSLRAEGACPPRALQLRFA